MSTIWKISNLVVDCGGFFRPHLDAASVNVVPKKEKMLNLLNPLSAGSEADYHFCDDRVKKNCYPKGEFNHSFGVINIKNKGGNPLLEVVMLTPERN